MSLTFRQNWAYGTDYWSERDLFIAQRENLGCDGTAVAFTNRSHSRLKLLLWDGTGVWLVVLLLRQGGNHRIDPF